MKPVNSKSLFHFICDQMEQLQSNSIDVASANAQAGLAKQAFNLLEHERKRAETELKLIGTSIKMRAIETKVFDDNEAINPET